MNKKIINNVIYVLIAIFTITVLSPQYKINAKVNVNSDFEKPIKEQNIDKSRNYKKDMILVKMMSSQSLFGAGTPNLKSKNVTRMEVVKGFEKDSLEKRAKKFKGYGVNIKTNEQWYKVYLKESTDIETVIADIKKETGVLAAEPDYLRNFTEGIPDGTSDPKMSQQWYLDQYGIKEAWNYLDSQNINPGGSRDVVVAVIDSGVDYNHPDLAANMWINSGEVADDGIDNDDNGFVDDVHGVNVVGNKYYGESGDPMDDNGHGTHVAGIIAAQSNNGIGLVGIAYNTQIMAIKAAQSSGVLGVSDIAQGILYAVDKGADVINMSFGGYFESTIEKDALQIAFSTSVLVAAAGNDSKSNESTGFILGKPMYPAAYPWVIGVMAENQIPAINGDRLAGFSNWDLNRNNGIEYEVMAPGVGISSTLPGGQYAAWSGTSMAAPVVSAIAALVRSKYTDKTNYSSRFIMGQIVSTGAMVQGITPLGPYGPIYYNEINALSALTKLPKPELYVGEFYTFDSSDINSVNNGNGVIDAGETINIAQIIRNRWGKADNVTVRMNAILQTGIPDPYVSFINSEVNYGAVSSFSSDDNGITFDGSSSITGVTNPFIIGIEENTPNDHIVKINLNITYNNGFDSNDTTEYSTSDIISFVVRHASELPRVIDKDMTLTKDNYWIIPDKTLIKSGVTVNVEPGTHIQFWGSDASGPYAVEQMAYLQVEGRFISTGTAEEPVEIYTSDAYKGYNIRIYSTYQVDENNVSRGIPLLGGYSELKYTKISNPDVAVNIVDHCYFSQDIQKTMYVKYKYNNQYLIGSWYGPSVSADSITNSLFYKMGNGGQQVSMLRLYSDQISNCLFDSCVSGYDESAFMSGNNINHTSMNNNVFLKNYYLDVASYASFMTDDIFVNNAILNNWITLDPNKWMKIFSKGDRNLTLNLDDNYWGTTSTQLIDKSVVLDFNSPSKNYAPILTAPSTSTYPLVADTFVSTQSETKASKVGAERVTFHVIFNRDMNQGIQPQVSFGPDEPYTDYVVNGDWIDARNWEGTFNVNPITGDGYQFIRVSGAVDAADPWLVTGNDEGRFKFEIVTSGTESMNLQAEGREGSVYLSWTQNDFDLLAGYNVYRSETRDGEYSKINATVISNNNTDFEDITAEPGKTNYYKFTVIKTDMSESNYSNTASAASIDTVAPVITHTLVNVATLGLPLQIFANITDNVIVKESSIYYRKTGNTQFIRLEMIRTTGDRYSANIEGINIQAPGIDYYIESTDGISITRNGSSEIPNQIIITDAPKITAITPNQGPESGGTSIVLTGINFKEGAKVTFNGAAASNVVVNSNNQITATTPAHYPANVDVTVINPDGCFDTTLNGFKYIKTGVDVTVGTIQGHLGQTVEVPISISQVSGFKAADITIDYDSELITAQSVRLGSFTNNFVLSSNINMQGQVVISMATESQIAGSGIIGYVSFKVADITTKQSSQLALSSLSLNGGNISGNKVNGTVHVSLTHSVSGTTNYYSDGKAVPGVDIILGGSNNYSVSSAQDGTYKLSNVVNGEYKLKASKSTDANGITAYDASLILQYATRLISLTSDQLIAADVNSDKIVNSMDASSVLSRSAGLISLPFNGSGKVWTFAPSEYNYSDFETDRYEQNFRAVLIGDVSGSWSNATVLSDPVDETSQNITNVSTLSQATLLVENFSRNSDDNISVPISAALQNGSIYSADIDISYDPAVVMPISVDKTPLSNNLSIAYNNNESGSIRISMAGASPITTDGHIFNIKFNVLNGIDKPTGVVISSAEINEGSVASIINETENAMGITLIGDNNAASVIVNKTLQMNALISPEQATYNNVIWNIVNGTGIASISSTGLLTGLSNGTVTVFATVADGSGVTNYATINVIGMITVSEVTFDSQGGSAVEAKTANYNTSITAPAAPERTGYTFGGWYKEAACSNAWDFGVDAVAEDTTLYAKWTINSYDVTFDSQEGSPVTAKTANYNNSITAPATPTRTGYTFGGWYKEVYCTNAWDFDVDRVSANTILYAKWTVVNNEATLMRYRTHVQNIGWQDYVWDGAVSGTTGQGLRLEGINVEVTGNQDIGVQYSTHIQNIGWQDYVSNGDMSGTSGLGLRLEAIKINLTGADASRYDLYYRVHAENFGWLDWAKNGQESGTAGFGYRLEGIQIKVVPVGSAAPGSTLRPFVKKEVIPVVTDRVQYRTHVQDYGWQGYVWDGAMSGTSGQGKRLEGINIKLGPDMPSGSIGYSTHVQDYGWMASVYDGTLSGTTGEGKRLEGIRIALSGEVSTKYDVYYRVHAQEFGWLDWAKNGQDAGTAGFGYRLEGIEVQVLLKGTPAPGSTAKPFVSK